MFSLLLIQFFLQFLAQFFDVLPPTLEAFADLPPYVFVEVTVGGIIVFFVIYVGLTLLVALFGADDRRDDARKILRLLLNFLRDLVREFRNLFGSSS